MLPAAEPSISKLNGPLGTLAPRGPFCFAGLFSEEKGNA
jgi:hypothetical protein